MDVAVAAEAPEWHIGADFTPSYVIESNRFVCGDNPKKLRVDRSLSASLRCDFTFSPTSVTGKLYPATYQGFAIGWQNFSSSRLLGSPASLYVYQGSPITPHRYRFWLGYEWNFGAAMGWHLGKEATTDYNAPVSTFVTAHMALALKLHYRINRRWQASLSVVAAHYSNGNTSWPNAGLNTVGASIGASWTINPAQTDVDRTENTLLIAEADKPRWIYDLVAFGSWRKHGQVLNGQPWTCPGKFAVAGLQFSPMRQFNRYVAAGAALDMQFDEGAGLGPYWVPGTIGSQMLFYRPPFFEQVSIGLSAHAELIMPIFAVNVGLGVNLLSPDGEKRFYQSLTLKTFVGRRLFVNVGYRLGDFSDPQNLMLGAGYRF